MKAFIAACLILALLIGSITANGILLHDRLTAVIDALLTLPEQLPPGNRSENLSAGRLAETWEEARRLATLTVSAARIESVNRALAALYAGWDTRDDALYRESRAELLLLLTRIRAAESFSVDNIV